MKTKTKLKRTNNWKTKTKTKKLIKTKITLYLPKKAVGQTDNKDQNHFVNGLNPNQNCKSSPVDSGQQYTNK